MFAGCRQTGGSVLVAFASGLLSLKGTVHSFPLLTYLKNNDFL